MKSKLLLIKNPNRSRAPGYFLILLGIDIAVVKSRCSWVSCGNNSWAWYPSKKSI